MIINMGTATWTQAKQIYYKWKNGRFSRSVKKVEKRRKRLELELLEFCEQQEIESELILQRKREKEEIRARSIEVASRIASQTEETDTAKEMQP